jgi:hypothetical protein
MSRTGRWLGPWRGGTHRDAAHTAVLGLGSHEGIELTPIRVVEDPEVTHVRFRVDGRSALTPDERVPAAPGAES